MLLDIRAELVGRIDESIVNSEIMYFPKDPLNSDWEAKLYCLRRLVSIANF